MKIIIPLLMTILTLPSPAQSPRDRSADLFAELEAGSAEIRRHCGSAGGRIQEIEKTVTSGGVVTKRKTKMVFCTTGTSHEIGGTPSTPAAGPGSTSGSGAASGATSGSGVVSTAGVSGLTCEDQKCACVINGIYTDQSTAESALRDGKNFCSPTANPFEFLRDYDPKIWQFLQLQTCGDDNADKSYVSRRDYTSGLNVRGIRGNVEFTCNDGSKKELKFNGPFTVEVMNFILGKKNLLVSANTPVRSFKIGENLNCTPDSAGPSRCSTNCPGGRQQCQTTLACNDEVVDIVCDCAIYDGEDGPKNCLLEFFRKSKDARETSGPASRRTTESGGNPQ